jgi:phosphatidylinositol alpha-mannosyltransferase
VRIAIVCPYAWDRFGGVQSHIRALAGVLRTRGHDVTVVAPRAGGKEQDRADEDILYVGRAVGIPANGSIAPIAFGPIAAARVGRALESAAPDVVHLHEPLIPSLSLLALLTVNRPCVGTFHTAAESSVAYKVASPVLGRAIV